MAYYYAVRLYTYYIYFDLSIQNNNPNVWSKALLCVYLYINAD